MSTPSVTTSAREAHEVYASALLRTDACTLFSNGFAVHQYEEKADNQSETRLGVAIGWVYLSILATVASIWAQTRGSIVGFFALAITLPLFVLALVNLGRAFYAAWKARTVVNATHVLVAGWNDFASTVVARSPNVDEIEKARREIEQSVVDYYNLDSTSESDAVH